MSQPTLDDFIHGEEGRAEAEEVVIDETVSKDAGADRVAEPVSEVSGSEEVVGDTCRIHEMFGDRLILHRGSIHIFFYPERPSIRADIYYVFYKCPPSCLEKAIKELMDIADTARSCGVEVYSIGKAYDDDLYLTIRTDEERWEKALKTLQEKGFKKVVKTKFNDFNSLREYEARMWYMQRVNFSNVRDEIKEV